MSELAEGKYEPYEIPQLSQSRLEILREKINSTVWPNELEKDYDWDYGAPTWAVKPLVEKWGKNFDWNEFKEEIGQWNHYQMKIDGLLVHYIHERSQQPDAIPIVLLHGWPSTFYEFHKIIKPLRDGAGRNQVIDNMVQSYSLNSTHHKKKKGFHVIVPSLPGFGFSEAPKEKGYGVTKMASIINTLMVNLGYDKYSKLLIKNI